MLGRSLQVVGARRGVGVDCIPDESHLDITDGDAVQSLLASAGPTVVINAAGFTDVDGAEGDPETADRVNHLGPANLAQSCRDIEALLVHYSTDYIFDGTASRPYRVDDPPNPVSCYGRSKWAGEQAIVRSGCRHLILRSSWLYAAHGRNFVRTILDLAAQRPVLDVVDDQKGRPTLCDDLAELTWRFLESGAEGTWHACNDGACSWYELAGAVVESAALNCTIRPCATSDHPRPARRPAFSVLDIDATADLLGRPRHWRDALKDCMSQLART